MKITLSTEKYTTCGLCNRSATVIEIKGNGFYVYSLCVGCINDIAIEANNLVYFNTITKKNLNVNADNIVQ